MWGEHNANWGLEEWKRMFRKRVVKIDDIDPENPHATIELKKRLFDAYDVITMRELHVELNICCTQVNEIFGNNRSSGGRGGRPDFFNDLGDIFDVFNRGGGGSTRARSNRSRDFPRDGEDLRYDMEVDFMDAFNGGKKKVQYKDPVSGQVKNISVSIPRGVKDDQKLRLKGKGMPGENGGSSGDLYIAIHIKRHPNFERRDDDIHIELEVPFTTATLGGKVQVQGVEKALSVSIPAGTADSSLLRLKNQGFYKIKSEQRGNLFVKIRIQVPKKLNGNQKELLEKLKAVGV